MPTKTYKIRLDSRWPIEQVDAQSIEIHVPRGGDIPMFNPEFTRLLDLRDVEVEAAELAVLESVVWVK